MEAVGWGCGGGRAAGRAGRHWRREERHVVWDRGQLRISEGSSLLDAFRDGGWVEGELVVA